MIKPINVTQEWAERRHACPKSMKRFFARWPEGLVLNRRNLCAASEVLPVADLMWFGGCMLRSRGVGRATWGKWFATRESAISPAGFFVTSPAKKRAFAERLADMLKLP